MKKKSWYNKISDAIKRYEDYSYPTKPISWITEHIDWCWRFRKISASEKNELVDRIIYVMDMRKGIV